MSSFRVYFKIPEEEIRGSRDEFIARVNAFFDSNPLREAVNVGVWFGRVTKIRQDNINEDVNAAVELAVSDNKGRPLSDELDE